MSTFSTIACFSALSACSKEDVISAYARMVVSVVQKKRYTQCETEELCTDFEAAYGFPVPYHPMRTIMEQCAHLGFFTYNSSLHKFFPNYQRIDKEDFISIIQTKDLEYKQMIDSFGKFLISSHNLYCSKEDLDERIRAFIERYGIKSKTDKGLIHRVRDDYFFAEFLVHCEESGNYEVLNYLDEYTIGIALSEIFTFSEYPESFTTKNARVYLDTGLLFKLFGIDSSQKTNSYVEYIKNMQRLGIHLFVYEHTILEMIGIIESAKCWIGNPNYDATLSSESTYYFVSNNWTVEQIDQLSASVRTRLREDFNIKTDKMPYPCFADIHTPYEADIKELIIDIYKESGSSTNTDDISYTIDQDAKSIFFTYHKNSNLVAYHVDDVQNIFITTNNSLAKVGYRLTRSIATGKEYFIPAVMNDIKWGTLIWFHSPAKISSINRPRLVSAAYAAFRPNQELIKKLNAKLILLEAEGQITPEQCYLLKVNPIAQKLLAQKTMNDPERFTDSTPLDILKELSKEAYEQGIASRQVEVDMLSQEKEAYKQQLAYETQQRVVSNLAQNQILLETEIKQAKGRKKEINKELSELSVVSSEISTVVKNRITGLRFLAVVVCLMLISVIIHIAIEYPLVYSITITLFSIIGWFIAFALGHKITYSTIEQSFSKRIRAKQENIRRYSDSQVMSLERELTDIISTLDELSGKALDNSSKLKCAQEKLEELGPEFEIVGNAL